MSTRPMSVADLEMVLGWARDEGWNPGLEDAAAFHAADPEGFFVAEVDGTPVAAISVVNHDAAHAFLGLYLCRPDFRGQGHAFALWNHALEHAGGRSVGLDGVPDQQANYARSGFVATGKTIRYEGQVPRQTQPQITLAQDLEALMAADQVATGHGRPSYARAWFQQTETRQTLWRAGDRPTFATFRRCYLGCKVGPFQASTGEDALALLQARPANMGDGPIIVDVPETSTALRDLLMDLGFAPSFETARMVKGPVAPARPPAFFGVMTLELG